MNPFVKNIDIFLPEKSFLFGYENFQKEHILQMSSEFFRKIVLKILNFPFLKSEPIDPAKFPIISIIWLRNLSKYRKSGIDREWMKNLENVGENRLESVEKVKIINI